VRGEGFVVAAGSKAFMHPFLNAVYSPMIQSTQASSVRMLYCWKWQTCLAWSSNFGLAAPRSGVKIFSMTLWHSKLGEPIPGELGDCQSPFSATLGRPF
jgi:hypothetical protein